MTTRRPESKVVLITGASSGIGAATAIVCGQRGMKIALVARRSTELESVLQRVQDAGGEGMVLSLDVTSPGSIESGIHQVLERFGRIDVLVTCAGQGCLHSVESASDEDVTRLIELNYLATLRTVRAVLPVFRHQKAGHFMVMGSVTNDIIFPNDALYSSTKAAIHRFSTGLSNELRNSGIHVTVVIPGLVDTSLTYGLTGLKKADPIIVARDIVDGIEKPRPRLITPRSYFWGLSLARLFPTLIAKYVSKRVRQS